VIRAALLATVAAALLAACGDDAPTDPTTDGRTPDAAAPDARVDAGAPDATPDAGIDATPSADRDRDGVTNDLDCAPDDAVRWRTANIYVDGDRDGRGAGDPTEACIGAGPAPDRSEVGDDCDDGDAASYQVLGFTYRDGDGDGRFVVEAGTLCTGAALPTGYRDGDPGTEADCAPTDPSAYRLRTLYVDSDGDRIGVEPAVELCIGDTIPAGQATVAGDCNAIDIGRWQLLAYSHRDADGDSVTTAESGTICSGTTLPPGYRTTGNGLDCAPDDITRWRTVDLYADIDRDGIGAGPAIPTCMGDTRPDGLSDRGTDCAPDDITRWGMLPYHHVNRDGDRATIPETGSVCSGAAVLPPYYVAPIGHDCDDADGDRYRWVVLYPDTDGDGVGTTPYAVHCLGDDLPAGQSTRGYDIDDGDPAVIEDEEDDDELLDLLF
jgi:hypothetical protein